MARILLSALALVFLAGCTSLKLPDPVSTDGLAPADATRSAEFLRDAFQQADRIQTFRGSYQAVVESPAGRAQFRLIVAFSRPEKLRLEVLYTGLNRLASMLTIAGGRAALLDAEGKRLFTGEPSRSQISRLTGVPLSAAELMLWFSGRFRPEGAGEPSAAEVFDGPLPVAKLFLSSGEEAGLRQCADRPGVLESFDLGAGGEVSLYTRYDCEKGEGTAGELPKTIRFWLPQDRTSGVLTLEGAKLNPNLKSAPRALFEPPAPSGVEILPLEDAARGALFGG